jgi:DNA-binding response OmpR family regulator
MKILIIGDEKELASDIVKFLSEEDYRCENAGDFATAKEKVSLYQYDCILLDLMLPGGDGFEILAHLRSQNKQDGVIIFSAKNTLEDKIKGLNIGADDYLAKPFAFQAILYFHY